MKYGIAENLQLKQICHLKKEERLNTIQTNTNQLLHGCVLARTKEGGGKSRRHCIGCAFLAHLKGAVSRKKKLAR
jgi:hypothetical protein